MVKNTRKKNKIGKKERKYVCVSAVANLATNFYITLGF